MWPTFNAVSMGVDGPGPGPIYQAGLDEWMAKAAVTDAIADYNTKVTAANDSPDGRKRYGLRELRSAA